MKHGAIILCGGLSTRMGRPKTLLPWRGRTMIEHLVDVLHEAAGPVVAVASAELELPPLRAAIVRDRSPHLGPLAGLREGLARIDADLVFASGADTPFLTVNFVRAMLAYGCAAVPEADGFPQPLGAVYPKALASEADALIAAGRMRLLDLLEVGNFRRIPSCELPDADALRGVNTPEEYQAALERDRERQPGPR